MKSPPKIYVEILIHGDLEDVWERTQNPHLHQKWDLRFWEIHYLLRPLPSEPQRFLYVTKLGFGLTIKGMGETVGGSDPKDDVRYSILKFWSDSRLSLIKEGAGYWRYIPTKDGIRFLTEYDYRVRFGLLGCVIDRLMFRPLIGWATAWSFDRLRLWIEKDLEPNRSIEQAAINTLAGVAVSFVWLYHGLVPKVLFPHDEELRYLTQAGVPEDLAPGMLFSIGVCELAVGIAMLGRARSSWRFILSALVMGGMLIGMGITSPEVLGAPFNPVSLNILVILLCGIGILSMADVPTATHCRREKPEQS